MHKVSRPVRANKPLFLVPPPVLAVFASITVAAEKMHFLMMHLKHILRDLVNARDYFRPGQLYVSDKSLPKMIKKQL